MVKYSFLSKEIMITAVISGIVGASFATLISSSRLSCRIRNLVSRYLSSGDDNNSIESNDHSLKLTGLLQPARDPFDPSKRTGYLSWDDYFMAIAFLSAQRSKDPNRQVGACLVSQSGVILGIGYNGFPRGCSDDILPWAKKSINGDPLLTKYLYVCHAEVNAILNKNHATARGQKLYVTMYPCNECAKIIIQSGVSEVIYFIDKNMEKDGPVYVASRKLLSMAGIKVRKHQPSKSTIIIDYKEMSPPSAPPSSKE